jgi:transposase
MNYRNKQWLREQYVEQEKTPEEIAEMCNSDQPSTIIKWIQRFDFELRVESPYERLHSKEWLHREYYRKARSGGELSDELGVAQSRVYAKMDEFGLKRRTLSEAKSYGKTQLLHDKEWLRKQYVEHHRTKKDIAQICECAWSTVSRWIDRHDIEEPEHRQAEYNRLQSEEWLREHYLEKGMTQREIADELDCCIQTVSRWVDRHDIVAQINPAVR